MLNKQAKSLLPQESVDRDALTRTNRKFKPRFTQSLNNELRRLKNSFYCYLEPNNLLGGFNLGNKNVVHNLSLTGFILLLSLGFLFSPNFLVKSLVHASEPVPNIQYSLPLNGYISTYFSSYHPGVDIASDLGANVHPVSFGVVENVIYDRYAYGTHIIVAHPNGVKSLYAHLGEVLVKKDQAVYVDTAIGKVGLTGNTSGPHLHVEIINNGIYMDPLALLPQLSALAPLSTGTAAGGNYIIPLKEEKKETELRKTLKLDFN